MKRVLVIAYYFPPSGGAGVQRVLKTCKYLREFGWEPIVYTAKDAAYPILDESLWKDVHPEQEILRGPIWEPYEWYKRFTGQGKKERVYSGFLSEDKKASFSKKLAIWIRGNFFIPDARRFWIRPSVSFISEWLKTNQIDAVFSSGPPHTVHMIGRGVKRRTGLPWIADFRDPWTNIDFYDQLMLSSWADRRHRKMEQSVLDECDVLTTVSWTWEKEFQEMGAQDVRVITNGFDHADFEGEEIEAENVFSLNHIGFLNTDRNPTMLWRALSELCDEIAGFKEALKLRFIGKTDFAIFKELQSLGLEEQVEDLGYISHDQVLPALKRSQVLLLLNSNTPNVLGMIPGKLYEYLAARRPILSIGPEAADFSRILKETGAGQSCDFADFEKIKRTVFKLYQRFKKGQLSVEAAKIDHYTRQNGARKIAAVLDEISAKKES